MLKVALQRLLVFRHCHPIDPRTGRPSLPPECPFERADIDVCSSAVNRVWPERLAASFTRRRFGSKGCQRIVRPFACSLVIPSCRSLFSITTFPSVTSSILWSGPTPIRDAASFGCPSFAAPGGNQPPDADGPHRFRYVPFGRDVSSAPGGASVLSQGENGCAAFAGVGASSASATCLFRESISHPVRLLSTLRTPRCREILVDKLTRRRLEAWHAALADSPRRLRTKRGKRQRHREADKTAEGIRRRRSSANRVLTILKAALNLAQHNGRTEAPERWRDIKPFKETDAPKIRYLSDAEAQRLVNACGGQFRMLVTAALLTGCRYGELAAMKGGDYNPDARAVHVPVSKSGKVRHVHLADEGREFFA
jgi:hypothetical protein